MASLSFSNPEFLVLLLAVPLLVLTHFYLYKFTKRKANIFSNIQTLKRVSGEYGLTKNIGSLIIRVLAITCVVLAAAGPSIHYQAEAQSSDYVLAIDSSASMTADDLTPTRHEAAKQAATRFVDDFGEHTRFGVVSFSGYPNIEQPLSDDHGAITNAIDNLEIQTVSGTDIGGAIITATNLLAVSERGKVVVLFTDGSSTTGNANSDPVSRAVNYAVDNNVVVHAVGMGRPGSAPAGYLPSLYNITAVYDPEELAYITNRTGGQLLTAADNQQLSEEFQQLLTAPESRNQTLEISLGFLLAALILLFLEWGLANTRYRFIP